MVFAEGPNDAQNERPSLLQRVPAAVQQLQHAVQLPLTDVAVRDPRQLL